MHRSFAPLSSSWFVHSWVAEILKNTKKKNPNKQKLSYIQQERLLERILGMILVSLAYFAFKLLVLRSTLRHSSPVLRRLCWGSCQKLCIRASPRRPPLNEPDSGSRGAVIWVDMQINISHHQPLVVGAWGQDDNVQPIESSIESTGGVDSVHSGGHHCVLPLNCSRCRGN